MDGEWETSASYTMKYGIPMIALVVGFHFLRVNFPHLRRRFLKPYYACLMNDYDDLLAAENAAHFRSLKSPGENEGETLPEKILILEVGVRDGQNFEHYPPNSVVTAVQTDPYHFDKRRELRGKFPKIEFRWFRPASSECLADFGDDTYDVIVSSLVLCSADNLAEFLYEVKRVLVPGGRFYFWEHVADRYGTRRHFLQRVFAPFWRLFVDGCRLTRRVFDAIDKAEFSKLDATCFYLKPRKESSRANAFILKYLIGPHVRGVAVK